MKHFDVGSFLKYINRKHKTIEPPHNGAVRTKHEELPIGSL
jgi:hypothetical protein